MKEKNLIPPAMEDIGEVKEMTGQPHRAGNEPPMVEITRREPWETTDVMRESEFREDSIL
ncbi:hypothetical protein [Ammoniphilus sp. YIM 78166]|uniref:hypothetical protein n=1 Tax=Ammoniphilus sp. YIM 78166 TaxID=1644106 RepID=UPI00106F3564|nr:hypothetical protein [Ammoniphilus sp. YIM 78166]